MASLANDVELHARQVVFRAVPPAGVRHQHGAAVWLAQVQAEGAGAHERCGWRSSPAAAVRSAVRTALFAVAQARDMMPECGEDSSGKIGFGWRVMASTVIGSTRRTSATEAQARPGCSIPVRGRVRSRTPHQIARPAACRRKSGRWGGCGSARWWGSGFSPPHGQGGARALQVAVAPHQRFVDVGEEPEQEGLVPRVKRSIELTSPSVAQRKVLAWAPSEVPASSAGR